MFYTHKPEVSYVLKVHEGPSYSSLTTLFVQLLHKSGRALVKGSADVKCMLMYPFIEWAVCLASSFYFHGGVWGGGDGNLRSFFQAFLLTLKNVCTHKCGHL